MSIHDPHLPVTSVGVPVVARTGTRPHNRSVFQAATRRPNRSRGSGVYWGRLPLDWDRYREVCRLRQHE